MRTVVCCFLCLLLGLTGMAFAEETLIPVIPDDNIRRLEDGFSVSEFSGDDYFEDFLASGGATSDMGVVEYLSRHLLGFQNVQLAVDSFACSAMSVASTEGGYLYGRNFDWYNCDALVLYSKPTVGYASLSTVNMSFLTSVSGLFSMLPQGIRKLAAIYAPLDGMNEKGLCVSVLMIQDGATIDQQTDKPDITTTTAVRMLLNKAATVDEAVTLLTQYDMHASMGLMVHFSIADAAGNSIVAEYIDNELVVTQTPVVTNFYLAQGERYGIGTQQSHVRYEQLTGLLASSPTMTMADVTDAMESVSKRHFSDGETTEWTIVMNQQTGEARYYHRENYTQGYVITLTEGQEVQ